MILFAPPPSPSALSRKLDQYSTPSDALLSTAFGWGRSTYWRGSVEEETPDPAAVKGALSFLMADPSSADPNDLSLTRDEALAVLRSFPETLNLDAEQQLRGNIAKLSKEWKIQGGAAKGCVKRTPRLLGYTVDCAGDCIVSGRERGVVGLRGGGERGKRRRRRERREREKTWKLARRQRPKLDLLIRSLSCSIALLLKTIKLLGTLRPLLGSVLKGGRRRLERKRILFSSVNF